MEEPVPEDDMPCGFFGHTRLNIVDLSERAGQPMAFGHLQISYNGELYNYRELRRELEAGGYTFRSDSDTEVILSMYHRDGPAMLPRLNGMFAIAIWDDAKRELFLARDRYGIKPLYVTNPDIGLPWLGFASELKSLLALPGVPRDLDMNALYEHFTFHFSLGDKTLVNAIRHLSPATWATYDAVTGSFQTRRYWEPVFAEPVFARRKLTSIKNELRDVFETAVASQLIGDVPIGSFLSGGMDTGAISTIATRQLTGMHTFSCGFDVTDVSREEQRFDERMDAIRLARRLGTEHHEMTLESDAITRVFPEMIWYLDDFQAGISYQNYLVNAMVKDHVTVVLSGLGGDELFAGYPWRYQPMLSAKNPEATYYQWWERILTDREKQRLFTPAVLSGLKNPSSRAGFTEVYDSIQAEHPLHKALGFEMRTFMRALLIVEDRLGMAHSVEARVPFLDNHLVDFCLGLPADAKLEQGGDGPAGKWILRNAFKGLLSDDILTRRKQGFTPPDASWYRGPVKAFIGETLLSRRSLERGIFQPAVLRQVLSDHFDGRRNHRFLIWSLLCLEWWQRLFLDSGQSPVPPKRHVYSAKEAYSR